MAFEFPWDDLTDTDEDDAREAEEERRQREIEAQEQANQSAKAKATAIGYTAGAQNIDTQTRRDGILDNERRGNIQQLKDQETPQTAAARAEAASVADTGPINDREQQFRQGQEGLIAQLQDQAAGRGPSLAQNQLRQAQDRNIKQALALLSANRGANPAQAGRLIGDQTALINQQAGAQSADLALQEQLAARQQLAGVLGQARSQDQGFDITQSQLDQQRALANAGFQQEANMGNAGFEQQANLANQQAELARQQQYNNLLAQYLAMGYSQNEAMRAAQLDAQRLALSERQGFIGANQQQQQNDQASTNADRNFGLGIGGLLLGGVSAGASAAALSDKTKKKNIDENSNDKMASFLNAYANQISGQTVASAKQGLMMSDVDMKEDVKQISPAPAKGINAPDASVVEQGANFLNGTGGAIRQAENGSNRVLGGLQAGGLSTPRMRGSILSDENQKKNKDMMSKKDFFDALKAYSYEYKDQETYGEGEHLGIMAQDLEQLGPAGEAMVMETPNGKMVDGGKMAGTALAGVAYLNQRQNALEEMLMALSKKEKKK